MFLVDSVASSVYAVAAIIASGIAMSYFLLKSPATWTSGLSTGIFGIMPINAGVSLFRLNRCRFFRPIVPLQLLQKILF